MLNAEKLKGIVRKYNDLQTLLQGEDISPKDMVQYAKESAKLEDLVQSICTYEDLVHQAKDLEHWKTQETDGDALAMITEELSALQKQCHIQEQALTYALLPKDEADGKNVILEIRSGAGGQEASLFAEDLWRMYQKFAQYNGWRVETLGHALTDLGGVREVSFSISGENVFQHLKFESGVHRVQRVPETESGGRIHTSTATVAVLPEAEDVDIHVEEKDLRIDVFRSSGPGGQSVNTTDSAVRITHMPTGIVVQQQDEKSQHKNKAKALKVLRARLYDKKREEADKERAKDRKDQVGTGDRSERIRTYNFPQSRVTDHRIKTSTSLSAVLSGEGLKILIEGLQTHHQSCLLTQTQDEA